MPQPWTARTENTAPADNDLALIVDDPLGSPLSQRVTLFTLKGYFNNGLPEGDMLSAENLNDVANKSTARTNLGVDPAGTDNSTPVTLVNNGLGFVGLSGQQLTLNPVNLGSQVTGNLPTSRLAGGTNANINTFWRGDGTWGTLVAHSVSTSAWTWSGDNAASPPGAGGMVIEDTGGTNRTILLHKTDADGFERNLSLLLSGDNFLTTDDPDTPPITGYSRYVLTSGVTDGGSYWQFTATRMDASGSTAPALGTRILGTFFLSSSLGGGGGGITIVAPPASSTSPGEVGQFATDGFFGYMATGTTSWVRWAIETSF